MTLQFESPTSSTRFPIRKLAIISAGNWRACGTSPAPNYGEAQSAESRKDFVHKMKIALKKLRETLIWLRIIERKKLCDPKKLAKISGECNELIAIFVKSVRTAESR